MRSTLKQTRKDENRRVLDEQLELLEAKKGEVSNLLAEGIRTDDDLVNDLVGILLVLRAALLANGAFGHKRDDLEVHVWEARELLSAALCDQYEKRCQSQL